MNGIANPHDFYDALTKYTPSSSPNDFDAQLADMAINGKWFGSLDSMALDGTELFGKEFGK